MAYEISAKMLLENPQRIEPALLEFAPPRVADLVAEISAAAASLAGALHPRAAASLAELVRIMNAYYSNLIEGHNTRPAEIVRALAGEFDADESRRNLQEEAAAHVRVQARVERTRSRRNASKPDFRRVYPMVSRRVLSERTARDADRPWTRRRVRDETRPVPHQHRTGCRCW